MRCIVLICLMWTFCRSHDLLLDWAVRAQLLADAAVWIPEEPVDIPARDMWNAVSNPYNITSWDTITCEFVEPNISNPEGGVTPKFLCGLSLGKQNITLKFKYDQAYNPVHRWGKHNNEVYASPVVERLLWALGFGADLAVPVNVRCIDCPIEPWTYIRKTSGLQVVDYVSGWVDLMLIAEERWKQKVPVLELNYTLAYLDWDLYEPADRIFLAGDPPQPGWGWPELYSYADNTTQHITSRDALTVIAAFVSHVDNYAGNQRVVNNTGPGCSGVPFLFIHDVGCTLGYGWDSRVFYLDPISLSQVFHRDFWPNAMDLEQWLSFSIWSDLSTCTLQIHGIPTASWPTTWRVSEPGRAMAAKLLSAVTTQQLTQLFTVSRVESFKGDSVSSWVAGFQQKLQRDLLNVTCGG